MNRITNKFKVGKTYISKWIYENNGADMKCPLCGLTVKNDMELYYNYCPWCGSKLTDNVEIRKEPKVIRISKEHLKPQENYQE